ncbi:hypothetical protein [Mesorhizobium sp. M0500]|uniref:hypothetical protein n=1 Tax=unclassified Mesorhizobium TaxID=325217 RepID=UPI003338BF70
MAERAGRTEPASNRRHRSETDPDPVLDMLANGLAMAEQACSEAERRHEATSADLAAACEAIDA